MKFGDREQEWENVMGRTWGDVSLVGGETAPHFTEWNPPELET